MGLQGSGGTIQYRSSHTRFPGYWRLLDVIYLPDENEDDEDDEDDDMHLDIDNMSYEELVVLGERIGNVSTGFSNEEIMARLKQRKYTCLATGPWVGEETCCVCQEYADKDDVGKLDCEHEYHVACIREWLAQNSCPICKKTALAPRESNPHQE
ncbi:hypothetical protein PVL29_026947 [Vitis rotundifolia]|uniref:RING-type E3 ubiquitin transferase n=1 Tax=Vitis rotundifolia TaxID=103349 RepID=A0AA38YHU4_VITRO|nr:hypothetical protein PVL29_026947 [Vitis rotundifolia]